MIASRNSPNEAGIILTSTTLMLSLKDFGLRVKQEVGDRSLVSSSTEGRTDEGRTEFSGVHVSTNHIKRERIAAMNQRLAFRVGGKSMTEMTASHMMNREVISFGKETYCNVLAETMLKGRFGSIPITNHKKELIGVVSEYDLMEALKEGMDLRETLAVEIMAKPVISITEEMPIEEVIHLLLSKHFIRVPVVDAEEILIGIISRRDILGCYAKSGFGPLPGFKHDV